MARKSGAYARFGSNPAVQAKRPGDRRLGLADDLQSDPRPWLRTPGGAAAPAPLEPATGRRCPT